MTYFNPRIALTRLRVNKDGHAVYDEQFSFGLNIIRGENSSGKSTIADFIFFALGGSVTNWKDDALRCTEVYAEVILNDQFYTLRRPVLDHSKVPMQISDGKLEAAMAAQSNWKELPYARTEDKASFSQIIFSLLGLPDLRFEAGSTVTINQLLRLSYCDQATPSGRIFRLEPFDSPYTREEIADLLLGVYDQELYELRERLRQAEKEYARVATEFDAVVRVFGRAKREMPASNAEAQIKNLQGERSEVAEAIKSLSVQPAKLDKRGLKQGEDFRQALANLNREIATITDQIETLDFEMEDSVQFIEMTAKKLKALSDASKLVDKSSAIALDYCPVCHAPLEQHPATGHCYLCKEPSDAQTLKTRYFRVNFELETQLLESRKLLQERETDRNKLAQRLTALKAERDSKRVVATTLVVNWNTEQDAKRDELVQRLGKIDQEIQYLVDNLNLYKELERLREPKERLNAEIATLKSGISARQQKQRTRRMESQKTIGEGCVEYLRRDLPREEAFEKAGAVFMHFADDYISVDDRTTFSESSNVYLRNAAHLAILAASCEIKSFRFPRFLILDGIENGGMTEDRSHNFQKMVFDISNKLQADHQIIMTTAMIDPDLEKNAKVVGRYYTKQSKSLGFTSTETVQNNELQNLVSGVEYF